MFERAAEVRRQKTTRTRMRGAAIAPLAMVVAAIVLALGGTGKPASASFPGTSGAIAFVSNREGFNDANNIFRMNADGFGPTRLTETPGKNMQPAWSSDGSEIAFINSQNGDYEVYRMRADGGDETQLTEDSVYDFAPAWGPGDTRLVFNSTRFNPSGDIFLMTLSATGVVVEVTKLTTYTGQDGDPVLSPDGKKVAFSSYRDGDYDIYVMRAVPEGSTNRPVKITKNTAMDGAPEWSPDGTQIVFHSHPNTGAPEIFRMKAAPQSRDNRPVNISKSPGYDYYPTWSPDGRHIAFQSNRNGNNEIWRVRATDGANPTNLTNNPAPDENPSWQPIR